MIVRHRGRVLELLRRSWGGALVTAFCFASIAWSDAPGLSARRAVVFSVTGAFAFYVIARFGLERFFRIVSWSAAFMAAASVVLIVALPSVGLEQLGQNAGLPRGAFATKNVFGYTMLVCSIFALHTALSARRARSRAGSAPYWAIWLLCLSCALFARSGTVMLAVGAAHASWLAAAVIRRHRPMRLGIAFLIVTALVAVIAAALMFPAQATRVLGKDDTLSGRDTLWGAVEDCIAVRPLLGHGYAAFWRDGGPEATRIWQLIKWNAPHAHNAVLELLLEIGTVGLLVAAVFYLVVYARTLRAVWRGEPWAGPIFAVLVAMFVQSLTEANALHQGDISWVLLLVADLTAAEAVARSAGAVVAEAPGYGRPSRRHQPKAKPAAVLTPAAGPPDDVGRRLGVN